VLAQGVLIPDDQQQIPGFRIPRFRPHIPPAPERDSYRISELSIDASVQEQVAQTQVSQTFVNTGKRQMEVSFVFPLPYDGAIDQLNFMVDGKELPAKLLPAEKAREIYEGYVRRYKDPALLEWIGTGMFKTSVFPVPAGASRTVSLKYSQLLKKELHAVDYLFPLSTARYTEKPIDKVSIRLSLHDETPIKNIYSPTHKVDVKRDDDHNAVVTFEAKDTIPTNDFRLIYDTAADKIGASVVSYWPQDDDQGYFILMASPEIKKESEGANSRKSIQFVVDRSGSMIGKKVDQAREAAKFVLNNLNNDDLFNVIAYDSVVNAFEAEMQRYNNDSHSKALGFINSINAGGSTNISDALTTALNNIKDDSVPSYIVFLTDGLPTAGETNEMKIVEITKSLNRYETRLICFGVGYDVNSRLIDRLTNTHHGQSEYVRPDEDIEQAVGRLYQKIASPVLTNVRIDYEFDVMDVNQGEIVNRVYPSEALDIFAGGQLIVVGRYKEAGTATIKLTGKIGNTESSFEFDAQFADKGKDDSKSFVAKLWASRRIGQIIDEIDLNGQNEELVKELIALSIEHGILTRYTSFLADENDDPSGLSDARRNRDRAELSLKSLEAASGQLAFGGRFSKQQYKGAQQLSDLNAPIQIQDQGASSGGQNYGLPAPAAGGVGGGGGGFVAGKPATPGDGQADAEAGVRQNKSGTMYKRGNVVIAANAADVDLEKAEITEIERYSKEYFDLINDNTKAENEIISEQRDGEQLVIRLRGKIYRFK
jgi:Ca-activated chloride channel family protein